jgi:hypothetical protein
MAHGGSGIVILRYPDTTETITIGAGLTGTTSSPRWFGYKSNYNNCGYWKRKLVIMKKIELSIDNITEKKGR